jgi:hypothetical protein
MLYNEWVTNENSIRKKKYEESCKINNNIANKSTLILVEKNLLKNQRKLTSKFIYNLFLNKIKNIPKFNTSITLVEQKNVFSRLHKLITSSNIILVNYKLVLNGLPVNHKFNSRYDKICFLCKKKTIEDLGHLFVDCVVTKKCFESISSRFKINSSLDQDLVQLKLKVPDEDYIQLSNFVYSIWRTRNTMKHGNSNFDPISIFKNIFNGWSISKTSI